jgi:hypothetical protein
LAAVLRVSREQRPPLLKVCPDMLFDNGAVEVFGVDRQACGDGSIQLSAPSLAELQLG